MFVSKYQTRLVEQHQQSGKQVASNQSQNVNQSTTIQTNKIATTEGQTGTYLAGGYQQQLSGGYQEQSIGGYQQKAIRGQALGYNTGQIQGL